MPHLKEFLHDNQIHFADLGVVLDVGFRVLALNHQIPARGHGKQEIASAN